MATGEKLVNLIKSSEVSFATADCPALKTLFENLSLILADCDGMGFDVIDLLWQGCRLLQDALDSEEQMTEKLAGAHEKLKQILVLLAPVEESVEPEKIQDPGESVYVIPEDDIELIDDFIVEGNEHLDAAESAMLELEADEHNSDVLNLIFRSFHTIKGMAGFMNLTQIGQLTHNAETLLDLARKGSVSLVGENADAVYKTVDMLKAMLAALRVAIGGDCKLPLHSGVDDLSALLKQCVDGTACETAAPVPPSAEVVPVQDAPAVATPVPVVSSVKDPVPPVPAPAAPAEAKSAPSKKHHVQEESIKVKTSRLDNLINMIGELVIAQLMVSESLKTAGIADGEKLEHDIVHQGKLIRELQELSTSMRMVPIRGIFQKMERMSRDLSRQAGKLIRFSMKGAETELDRTIVDQLADPLVHMIRNSCDHGIEPPELRKKLGKNESGHIELRAFHASGNIVIELEDDGKGLDREKLFEKGVRMGVFAAESPPSEAEIFNIIFTPGLSTAEKITKVSGRGVGMDVVKRNIENLCGRIDIRSIAGKGTLFTITLPLTLAIIDGQIVRIGNERFIIPIKAIRKSFRPSDRDLSSVQGRGEMVSNRGEWLRLIRLYEILQVRPLSTCPHEGLVVVVEQDNTICGLLVDDLLDQQQVVIKNLGGILSHTAGISGGAIMGNGQVSLILDIPGVIKISQV